MRHEILRLDIIAACEARRKKKCACPRSAGYAVRRRAARLWLRMSETETTRRGDKHMKTDKYVGMDVHQDDSVVGVAEEGRTGAEYVYGKISSDLHAADRMVAKLG